MLAKMKNMGKVLLLHYKRNSFNNFYLRVNENTNNQRT
jgi:hypothetical protein